MIALIYAPSSIAVEKKSKFLTCLFNFFFEETNPSTPQIKRDHGRSDPLMPQTSESHGQSDPLLTRQIKKELDQGEDHVSPDQYDKIVDQVLARHVPQMNAEQFTKVALDIIKNRSGSASGGGFADFDHMAKVFGLIQKYSQTLELNASQIKRIRAAMRKENQGELMWQNLRRDEDIDDFIDTAPFGKHGSNR